MNETTQVKTLRLEPNGASFRSSRQGSDVGTLNLRSLITMLAIDKSAGTNNFCLVFSFSLYLLPHFPCTCAVSIGFSVYLSLTGTLHSFAFLHQENYSKKHSPILFLLHKPFISTIASRSSSKSTSVQLLILLFITLISSPQNAWPTKTQETCAPPYSSVRLLYSVSTPQTNPWTQPASGLLHCQREPLILRNRFQVYQGVSSGQCTFSERVTEKFK